MFIILFGLAGSGKNYIGDLLESHFEFYFWDADEFLPEEMQQRILNNQSFTQEMRDKFTSSIIKKSLVLKKSHKKLVIAQALYKEKNRIQILKSIPDTQFLWVCTESKYSAHQLQHRRLGISQSYARMISHHFEEPKLPHHKIINNGIKKNLILQLKNYLASLDKSQS